MMELQIYHCHTKPTIGGGTLPRRHWLGTARNREDARGRANRFLGSDPEQYVVTPLTNPGDKALVSVVCGDEAVW